MVLVHSPKGYREMTENRLSGYLAGLPDIAARLGGRQNHWQIEEVSASDLSIVFVVEGPAGAICVKQAVVAGGPFGGRAALSLERMKFEEAALTLYGRLTPGLVPRVLHFDSQLALIIMERLHPHGLVRRGMIEGRIYPRFVEQISKFLAQSLFLTSDLGVPSDEKRERMALFLANVEPCRLTEALMFTEPYMVSESNRWTAPQLDDLAEAVRDDAELVRAVSALKFKFLTETQALLHGNLQPGSIMASDVDVKVLAPAFACYGPMGFDLGTLLGHVLLAYFSQAGHAAEDEPRLGYEAWLLDAVERIWRGFEERFLGLWRSAHAGDAYPESLFKGPDGQECLRQIQAEFMRRVFEDTLRFAGAVLICRTLGQIHVPELEEIEEPDRRAACERRAILLGRELVKDAHYVTNMTEVTAAARQLRDQAPAPEEA